MHAAISFLLLAVTALPASAAEGLTFLTAYLSDPVSLTEAMVRTCTSRHPTLAAQGAAALQSWRQRNAADARRAARLTAQELEKSTQSREEIKRTLAQLRQEHLEGWQRVAAFPTACSDYLASLERPESDISRQLPPPKGAAADDLRSSVMGHAYQSPSCVIGHGSCGPTAFMGHARLTRDA